MSMIPFVLEHNSDISTDKHRCTLLDLLRSYVQRYPEESETVRRYALFVGGEADCFKRTNLVGHITAAMWLVDAEGENVLLTHHRKLNKWLQLGGHADGNGDVIEVALTEAREESGIQQVQILSTEIFDLDIHPIPTIGTVANHLHYDVCFVGQTHEPSYVVSAESHDLAWVPIRTISSYTTEPSMLRMANKWLKSRQ